MIKKILHTLLNIIFPAREAERLWRNKRPDEISLPPASELKKNSNEHALFDYKNAVVRDIIWSLKYDGSLEAASLCATLMYDVIIHELTDLHAFHAVEKPLLLPIPLSSEREKERGFNQCVRIANALEKLDNTRYFTLRKNILKKHKNTLSQTKSQSKYMREENLRGCFSISNEDEIRGKDIILIDDVYTTGSTLAEATATLKRAGARSVLCFTFAH